MRTGFYSPPVFDVARRAILSRRARSWQVRFVVVAFLVAFGVGPSSMIGGAAAGTDRAGMARGTTMIAFSGRRGIYLMNADGRDVRLLIAKKAAGHPAWSRDRRRLAFDADNSVFVISADGTGLRRLVHRPGAGEPSWSPGGRRIVFDDDGAVDVIDVNGGHLRKLVPVSGSGNFPAPDWSPDGRRIAFSYGGGPGIAYGIAVINADGTGLRKLTNRRGGNYHVYDSAPRWSPDGRRIAFYQEFDCACQSDDPVDHAFDVAVMNADGSGLRLLTRDDVSENPSWSPSGNEIAYDTFTQIHVMNADGTARRRLTSGHNGGTNPTWSASR